MKRERVKKRVNAIKKSFNDRHPFVVPVVTLFSLVIIFVFGFILFGGEVLKPADSKVVKLYVDGEQKTIPTRASTVKELLENSGVEYGEKDLIEPSLNSQIIGEEFSVNIYRAKPVTVVDESGDKKIAKIADTTPVVMAKQAGFDLFPEDIVEIVEPDKSLQEGIIGTQVVINRATPIKMSLYGKDYNIRTHAETVADLVKERDIKTSNQSILPSLETKLKANQVVFITDPGKKIASVEEDIPFDQRTISDTGLEAGETIIRNEGRNGKRVVVYEIAKDGSRILLQEVIVSKPVTRVVVEGRRAVAPNASVAGDKVALMNAAGIPADQHASVDFIISRESGWRPSATNPGGCIGLGQRCSPQVLINQCPNWQTDAVCQLRHFNEYAVARYGSWNEAYAFWRVSHWW